MKLRAALVAACVLASAARAGAAGPDFDGARAWKDLQALAAAGPRRASPPGARGLIGERLRQAGFRAREAPFGDGRANLIGERAGRRTELVIVAARCDAGDASGPAALLELARALSAAELAGTLRLVFFDGPAGSEALAAQMSRERELGRVRALITLDRVADTDLRLETSLLAAPELVVRAFAAARPLAPPPLFAGFPQAHFDGDHLPFVRRGLRAVLPLASLRKPGRARAPRVSRESLARAGAFALALVRDLASAATP